MPAIKPERKRMQRNRIVDGAVQAIVKHGLAELSVSDIISASGLSAGAIYGYFEGKEQIILAAAEKLLAIDESTIVRAAATTPVPKPSMVLVPLVTLEHIAGVPPSVVVEIWGYGLTDRAVRELAVETMSPVEEALRDYLYAWFVQNEQPAAQAQQRAQELARPVLAMMQGALVQQALGMDASASLRAGLDSVLAN